MFDSISILLFRLFWIWLNIHDGRNWFSSFFLFIFWITDSFWITNKNNKQSTDSLTFDFDGHFQQHSSHSFELSLFFPKHEEETNQKKKEEKGNEKKKTFWLVEVHAD